MTEGSPEIWLIRHGETEWSRTGRHTGRTDVPLTPLGERQAAALARPLGGRPFALVLTSPLGRARATCQLAGYAEVAEPSGAAADRLSQLVPGGETVEQVGQRARRVIARAVAAAGGVALFAHAHVLRVLAACWLGLPPADGRLFALGPASVSVLGYERENRVLTTWNQDGHLAWPVNSPTSG